jgi:hypothetical protein
MSDHLPRRGFLARALGLTAGAAATATTAAIVPAKAIEPSRERFKTPLEYLQAMQAIGWTPLAMYQRLPRGGVHCMGVEETCPDEDHCARTWGQFHAIQMRTPAQLPNGGAWWNAVWHALYERGLRVDVTPGRRADA